MPIEKHPGGATITGNAVNWFAVKTVLSAMRIYMKTGLTVNRAYTAQAMRDFATRHTGKKYPRSKQGVAQAHDDLGAWLEQQGHPDNVPAK